MLRVIDQDPGSNVPVSRGEHSPYSDDTIHHLGSAATARARYPPRSDRNVIE